MENIELSNTEVWDGMQKEQDKVPDLKREFAVMSVKFSYEDNGFLGAPLVE